MNNGRIIVAIYLPFILVVLVIGVRLYAFPNSVVSFYSWHIV